MKILFHLGHPAHFHLFKNVIIHFKNHNHIVYIVIKKKDVLEDLVLDQGYEYYNILPEGRKDTKLGILIGQLKQDLALFKFCLRKKPDLLIGSTPAVAHVGRLRKIPSISLSEDDAREVMLFARTTYPFSDVILSPSSCNNDRWNKKTIKYESYHELAYLHPDHFTPDLKIVKKYIDKVDSFSIIRFSKLSAYHDVGVRGITKEIAIELVNKLKLYGDVFITSEKELPTELDQYRININPIDMHHILAFAKCFIGDSQTMAAEAGILGTPFIRVNDFVGKLGYLEELENKYKLGYGITPDNSFRVFEIIDELLNNPETRKNWEIKRNTMLNEKINFSKYLISFIENYKKDKLKSEKT
jgi:hypothetical protein